MKFPRTVRPLLGRFDMAPFACVLFLLVMFLMLGSIIYKPGVRFELPVASELPGTDQPSVTVAMDENGHYYFQNQPVEPAELKSQLDAAAKKSPEPLTLIIHADKSVNYADIMKLTLLAREAGIKDAWGVTQPSPAELRAPNN